MAWFGCKLLRRLVENLPSPSVTGKIRGSDFGYWPLWLGGWGCGSAVVGVAWGTGWRFCHLRRRRASRPVGPMELGLGSFLSFLISGSGVGVAGGGSAGSSSAQVASWADSCWRNLR